MASDDILAVALANGITPSIVAEVVEETQTSGGGGGRFAAAPVPGGQERFLKAIIVVK